MTKPIGNLIAEFRAITRLQMLKQKKLGKNHGTNHRDPVLTKLKAEVASLTTQEIEAAKRIETHKTDDAIRVGRMYAYLKKVIKHELGEATLAGYIAEAERLSEADAAAAAVEGY